jgi:hypothetical protein
MWTGVDGNVFNLLAVTTRTLKDVGMRDKAKEVQERVFKATSYEEAKSIMQEYVEVH